MLNFTDGDKKTVKDAYKIILLNLKDYLQQYDIKDEIEYSKIFFYMLHSGFFSMNRTISFDAVVEDPEGLDSFEVKVLGQDEAQVQKK